MEEDTLIQRDLFANNHELKLPNNSSQISEDFTTEELKKDSKKRPRQRKNSKNLINKFKNGLNVERKNDCINEKSYSYKTVEKQKLTPILRHYVQLKEENTNRLSVSYTHLTLPTTPYV